MRRDRYTLSRPAGRTQLDANLISQGTTPWASFGANAVAGSTLSYTYMGTDVTSLVQYVQTNSKWLAVLIDATG